MTVTRDAWGRLGMTHLRDRRTGRDWCDAGAPSPVLQIEGQLMGAPFALTDRSEFDLLAQRLTRVSDGSQELSLRVRARQYPIEIALYWRLRPGLSPVEKWYTLANQGHAPITITRLDTFSHQLTTPPSLLVHYVHKGIAFPGTLRVYDDPLADGEPQVIQCSATEAGDLTDSVPWFLLDSGRETAKNERRGGLLFAWTFSAPGRFVLTSKSGTIEVSGGLAPDQFTDRLPPGHTLLAPLGLFGPYAGTPDEGANEWHRFLHRYWSAAAADSQSLRVDYNTWYSLGAAVNEAACLRQLRAAADLGAEVFHLDAGWYRAPGDWHPDPKRFPHGLRPLVQEAHRRGMRFGLWVAFTQISAAMLARHPDWVTTPGQRIDPHRPFSYRTLTICLGNPAARAWIRRELERIVTQYGVDLLEYDQPVIEDCPVATHGHQAGNGSYAATLGFYELYDWLHRRFPHLQLENCMDGGHMMDFGVLRRTSFTSITDLTDPLHNRIAVYGATYPWPAYACETYMQDAPSLPPQYLFRSFMMGRWTISADVASWDRRTQEIARREIALYKRLRPLIRDGDVYHILPQATGRQWDGLEYWDPRRGEGVVFVFRPRSGEVRQRIPLAGLEAGDYEVRLEDNAGTGAKLAGPGSGSEVLVGGALGRRSKVAQASLPGEAATALEREGLEVTLPQPNSAAIVHLRKLPRSRPLVVAGISRLSGASGQSLPPVSRRDGRV